MSSILDALKKAEQEATVDRSAGTPWPAPLPAQSPHRKRSRRWWVPLGIVVGLCVAGVVLWQVRQTNKTRPAEPMSALPSQPLPKPNHSVVPPAAEAPKTRLTVDEPPQTPPGETLMDDRPAPIHRRCDCFRGSRFRRHGRGHAGSTRETTAARRSPRRSRANHRTARLLSRHPYRSLPPSKTPLPARRRQRRPTNRRQRVKPINVLEATRELTCRPWCGHRNLPRGLSSSTTASSKKADPWTISSWCASTRTMCCWPKDPIGGMKHLKSGKIPVDAPATACKKRHHYSHDE